jgi:DNA-binding GntR family transcriptional regulator
MADQIAASIRDAISRGKLRSGTHLLEVRIAREMQTSRVPVREALMQLEQEGFVTRQPGRGTFVAEFTEESVREVASLRSLLEGFAARKALRHLTAQDLQYLETLAKDMLEFAKLGDFPRVVDCDFQFHNYLVRLARHQLLENIWTSIDRKIRAYLSVTNLMFYDDMKSIVHGHLEILHVLQAGDEQRLDGLMKEHIDEMLNVFVGKDFLKASSRSGNHAEEPKG